MTDVLISIEHLLPFAAIAVALGGLAVLKNWLTGGGISGLDTLKYRSASDVLALAGLTFLAQFFAVNSIAQVSVLPWDTLLARLLLALPAPILLACAAMAYRQARLGDWAGYLLNEAEPGDREASPVERVLWPLAGLFAVFAGLLFLEHRQPYYFTQDDNLAVNLAEILQACHSFFQGVFPTWNPYQYLGSPNTTLGWYALTYPPTYFSYWVAKTLLGNENATLEVFTSLHLLLGYLALYWAIRREGCRPSLAMLGASCCVISGYALIFSRSWYQFSAVPLWMALLVVCVQSLARGNQGWKWILSYGVVMGVAFHAGHVQMWIYSVMLADLAIMLMICVGEVPVRAIWATISAHFLALAIAAPLLVPQALTTVNVLRRLPDSRGIVVGLIGLFIPATVHNSAHPIPGWIQIGQPKLIGEMYYSGTLFVAVTAFLLLSLLAARWTKSTLRRNLWFICGLVAFLLALGDRGLLWTAMSEMPGFDRFRFPFKFIGYIVLFSSIAGAIALERLMRHKQWGARAEVGLAAVMWIVLSYHVTLCTAAFYSYGFKPYPQPNPVLARRFTPQDGISYPKLLAISGESYELFRERGFRSADPHFIDSYMNQWPTVLHAFSIEGYNPLVSESATVQAMAARVERNLDRALYEYGVEYVVQYDRPEAKIPLVQRFGGAHVIYESPTIRVQQLRKPRPMSFATDAPESALPVEFDGAGATIRTSTVATGGRVILNMLWRREFCASADGARIPVTADDCNRIALPVPAGTRELRVTFRPPWEYGFLLSGVALVMGLAIGFLSVRASAVRSKPARIAALASSTL